MFQLVVEKMLAAEGVQRTDLTREEFTKKVWEWKEKSVLFFTICDCCLVQLKTMDSEAFFSVDYFDCLLHFICLNQDI